MTNQPNTVPPDDVSEFPRGGALPEPSQSEGEVSRPIEVEEPDEEPEFGDAEREVNPAFQPGGQT